MAEEHGVRKESWQAAPWTKQFTAFKIAVLPNKLLLAAAGIVVMAFGWWILGWIFYSLHNLPKWSDFKKNYDSEAKAWGPFKDARKSWNLLHELAGTEPVDKDAADLAESFEEFKKIEDFLEKGKMGASLGKKPYGKLRTLPWFEDRGPNPYLTVMARLKGTESKESRGDIPGWIAEQVPVLLEPLFKFFAPVAHFFDTSASFWVRLYLFLVIVWTLATWALFGGAITRIAVVQAARPSERVGMFEALRFARSRLQSFFSAPLIPLVILAILVLIILGLGFVEQFTVYLGDIVLAVVFWPIIFVLGLIMAVVLVGLIGWPLMYATISAEGSDSFDALSRSYSYVYQSIWRYLWYALVALVYGAALVFFVGFMGSLTVYLGKWGVSQAPFVQNIDRDPTYLFMYAPTSFGWRDLFLHDSPYKETRETIRPNGQPAREIALEKKYQDSITVVNQIGAFFVSMWLYLIFLLVVGFGYSYFWTSSSIIYLLMRKHVDDTELDEIHLEEDEDELPEMPKAATETAEPAAAGFTMVEPPALKPNTPPDGEPATGPEEPPSATPTSSSESPPPPSP